MSTTIQTKYGTATIDAQGYYVIHSKENRGKKLHRLIFEDFYNIKLPSNIDIHHNDGNRINNEIWNLIPLTHEEHSALHSFKHTENTKQKIREAKLGKKRPKESKQILINKSKSRNTTGYFRVIKQNKPEAKQGFLWIYYYHENNKVKRIASVSLVKLKEKVLAKGLDWIMINKEKAMKTCKKYGYDLMELV